MSILPFSFEISSLGMPFAATEELVPKTGFFTTGIPFGKRGLGPSEWTIDANELEATLLEVKAVDLMDLKVPLACCCECSS